MTAGEVKELLKIYNDIPQLIAEEFATIRNCEDEKDKIALPPVNLSVLPRGKELPNGRTAHTALADQARYYEDEIKHCYKTIAELREKRDWVREALDALDWTDRLILQLAYIGPADSHQRHHWRAPKWAEIAGDVGYCEDWARIRGSKALFTLSEMSSRSPNRARQHTVVG